MEHLISAFRMRDLQNLITIYLWLQTNGKSVEDLKDYLTKVRVDREEARQKYIEKREEWEEKAKKCPECSFPMFIEALSENECHWTCPNCRFGVYRNVSRNDELRAYGLIGKSPPP